MNYCHPHNSKNNSNSSKKKYGIKIMLPPDDCLGNIIGSDWSKQRWFESEEKRDVAFESMKIRHGYYRKTDSPTQIIEKISR